MPILVSPGVSVQEYDNTTVVPAVSTTIGGYAGDFVWGPANSVTTVDSENSLVGIFGKPDANTYASFWTAANFLAYGNNLKVVRTVGATAKNATVDGTGILIENRAVWANSYSAGQASIGEWAARYVGGIGNSLLVSICPSSNGFSQTFSTQAANVNIGSNVITFNSSILSVIANGDLVKIGTNPYAEISGIAGNGLVAFLNTASVITANTTLGTVIRKWKYADSFASAPGTSVYAASVGGANDEMHIAIVDTNGLFTNQGANVVVEVFPFVSKASDAKNNDGTTNFHKDVVFNQSKYIHWMKYLTAGTNWGTPASGTVYTDVGINKYSQLAGGLTVAMTDATIQMGYDRLANPDEIDISLLLSGAASLTLDAYILAIAETRRDCVAFLSPRIADVVNTPGNEETNCISLRNSLSSSSFTVMDCNWKYMFDKYNNTYRWVPMNGDIAGLCVKTDAQRDPWYSPAGFNRGQIKNVVRLAWNPNQSNRDNLYKNGVNPVGVFPGQGAVLYGDKTMQSKPSAFDRINVRRLFIVLEKAISTAAKYSLFEFNDEFTRAQFINLVEPFLRDIQGRRGIFDYRVVCDETNNTPEVVDTNRFVGDIYIKPARSINFISLNFIAVGTGVSFTEKAGSFS